jgi:hypothetical protein
LGNGAFDDLVNIDRGRVALHIEARAIQQKTAGLDPIFDIPRQWYAVCVSKSTRAGRALVIAKGSSSWPRLGQASASVSAGFTSSAERMSRAFSCTPMAFAAIVRAWSRKVTGGSV